MSLLRPARMLAQARARQERQELADRSSNNCNLVELLLDKWTDGHLSATQLIELASAAAKDLPASDATREVGGLGYKSNATRTMNNSQRDLLRLLERKLDGFRQMPAPVRHAVPFCNFKSGEGARVVELPIAPLHRAFAHEYKHFREQFWKTWGTPTLARQFWQNVGPDDKNVAQWRSKLADKDLTKVLLISIHGDGVPVFKHKSLMVWSAMSLLGEGPTRHL